MDVNRGEIYWIDSNPYRAGGEHVQHADRPAIIVSNDEINSEMLTKEVVYLTTRPKADKPTHCTIRSSRQVSTALCEQIQTVSNEQIGEYMGTCTEEEMAMVEACIQVSLQLSAGAAQTSNDYYEDKIWYLEQKIEEMKIREQTIKEIYEGMLARG